jgi:hypothetical protein
MTQTIDSTTVRVMADNFVRAESHTYFGNAVKQGGFGKFYHYRDPMPIDAQTVVRANRDTLYSYTFSKDQIGSRYLLGAGVTS